MSTDLIRIHSRPVSFSPSTAAVIAEAGGEREPAVLDSVRPDPVYGRYTVVACDPLATFVCGPRDGDPFEKVRWLLRRTGVLDEDQRAGQGPGRGLPFAGGWIGYFAYEAGRFIERLPATTRADVGLPVARFALYDSAALFDNQTGQWRIVATDFADWRSGKSIEERLTGWEALFQRAAAREAAGSAAGSEAVGPGEGPVANISREQHLQMVRRARDYIAAGDIFQVNLARRETLPAGVPPLELYLRLRQTNPGTYSSYLAWVDRKAPAETRQCAILSSSPELFLDLVGREVISRPIKGTRARSVDPQADERLRLELAASPKDRAELAMIVDLTRNDLGRVCDYGSIEVVDDGPPAGPFALERHPTVHHLVATVTGRLADGRDAIDLLRACFPCGSITGAPKVRAMEIIDELEPTERSVYTGAIGCFAPGGRMTMNVAIRTIIQAGGRLHWYAGGGIVADSDPLAEYDEAVAKALGMRKAVEQMCGMPPAAGGHAVAQPAATASTQAMLSPPAAHDLAGVPTAPAETEMLP